MVVETKSLESLSQKNLQSVLLDDGPVVSNDS